MHFRFSAPPLPALRFPRFTLRIRCSAFPRYSLLCRCFASHGLAVQLMALHCLCNALQAYRCTSAASRGRALPVLFLALPCSSNASQRRALAWLGVSVPFRFNALQCAAELIRCLTGPCFACAFPFGAIPWPVSSSHSLASPFHRSAKLFHCVSVLLNSAHCRFIAMHRQAFLAVYALALPPITLPSASSSSQTSRPFPLFLHCPRPRYMP